MTRLHQMLKKLALHELTTSETYNVEQISGTYVPEMFEMLKNVETGSSDETKLEAVMLTLEQVKLLQTQLSHIFRESSTRNVNKIKVQTIFLKEKTSLMTQHDNKLNRR
jgi:hypothetical protein